MSPLDKGFQKRIAWIYDHWRQASHRVIYRFKADGFPIHVGQQVDLFIEAPPISEITRKKLDLSVPNPLARSSYNWTE
jgi:hypothetical protein